MNHILSPQILVPTSANRRFDSESGMFYVDYSTDVPVTQLRPPELDEETTLRRFLNFVEGEATAESPAISPHTKYDVKYASTDEINELVFRQSEQLVLSGALDTSLLDDSSSAASRLWTLFQHKILGNRRNRKYDMPSWLADRLARCRSQSMPLHFVLLAFPFKDQNPFRTVLEPWDIDLGEIVFLARLAALSLASWRLHPFGAEWIILSDASLYAPIFEIPVADARRYMAAIDSAIRRYNLQGMVKICDLKEHADRYFNAAGVDFEVIKQTIMNQLKSHVDHPTESETRNAFLSLVRGQVQGLNLKDLVMEHGPEEVWHAVYRRGEWWDAPDNSAQNIALETRLHETARRVALEYAATNIAMAVMGVDKLLVPGALRTTVHAKPEQLAVPRLGRSYPWNGTAVLSSKTSRAPEAFSVDVRDVGTFGDHECTAVVLPGHERPWYFERMTNS